MKRILYTTKDNLRQARHARVRSRVIGSKDVPRLSVFRGLKEMILQLIDDERGVTVVQARTSEIDAMEQTDKTRKVAAGYTAGKLLADRAKQAGITKVVFDRGGYRYHGRVAAAAEGARAGGLEF